MSTRSQDRAGLCSFTFGNGHRCRTPRCSSHPHHCYYHARKEAQARAADEMGRDVSYFFSGRYLSACDLSSALGRLFTAVAQGQVKPRTASTLAYLAQTLVQTIQISQHEYINAFSTDSWRASVRSSVNDISNYMAENSNPDADQPSGPQPGASQEPPPTSAPRSNASTEPLPATAPQPAQSNPPQPATIHPEPQRAPQPRPVQEPRPLTPPPSSPPGESQPTAVLPSATLPSSSTPHPPSSRRGGDRPALAQQPASIPAPPGAEAVGPPSAGHQSPPVVSYQRIRFPWEKHNVSTSDGNLL